MTKLTDKQQTFVEEYLVDLNATQAAIRAGYSEKTAKDIGCQNLAKLYIQDAISKAMDARSERTAITADNVLKEIASLAFKEDEIRDNDKLKALEMLGRNLVLFTNKLQHDGAVQVTEIKRTIVKPEPTSS